VPSIAPPTLAVHGAIVRADVAVPATIEPLSEKLEKWRRGVAGGGVALVSRGAAPRMVVALDRPVPRRAPAEHARRRAERLGDRRLVSPPERARWLGRRTVQLARLAQVADAQRVD